ncbi:MAG TPA: hypothetical protein VF529_07650 [Solirubrobacteraceae bacterium]
MRRWLLVPALLLLLPAASAAAQEPVELAKPGFDTYVGAAAGWTAWWARSGARRAVLAVRAPDATVTRPVRAGRRIFPIDLGTDAGGRVVAAYSRCPGECVISLLDLASGAETKLPAAARTAQTLVPSVAGGRVAYVTRPGRARTVRHVRRVRRGGRRVRVVRRVRLRSLGTVRVRDVGRGTETRVADGPFVAPALAAEASAVGLDYDGETVAVNWTWPGAEVGGNVLSTTNWQINAYGAGGDRRVSRTQALFGEEAVCPNSLAGPALLDGGVVYADVSLGGWVSLRDATGAGGAGTYAKAGDAGVPQVTSLAVDGPRLVVAEGPWNGNGDQAVVREYRHGGFANEYPQDFSSACT